MKLSISTLALAILSLATPTFAGEQNTQTNIFVSVNDTTQVISKFGDKLDQYLNVLASKAGVAVDHFYPIFVRQQVIAGISELLLLAVGVIVSLLFIRMAIVNLKSDTSVTETKAMFGFVAGSVVGIIVVFNIMITGSDAVGKICNPEYYAVQSLVQMIK